MTATRHASDTGMDAVDFASGLRWEDVPEDVRRHLAWLLLDFAAVCVAGRAAPASGIASVYAHEVHAAGLCTSLYDGGRLAAPGAAWTNGVLANALDYDDGHRITKGHPGAIVIPAALAAAEAADASMVELLEAIAVGYELAVRAGTRLHATEAQYHASAAWGALGAAAAASRLLGLAPAPPRRRPGGVPRPDRAHAAGRRRSGDDQGRDRVGRVSGRQLCDARGRRVHRSRQRLPGGL